MYIEKKLWLGEGFILQNSKQEYWLGQGPFSYSNKPEPQSLYHPDFFLNNPKPWLKPSLVWKANKKQLVDFLFEQDNYKIPANNKFNLFTQNESIKNKSLKSKKRFFTKAQAFQLNFLDFNHTRNLNFFENSEKPSFIQYQEVFFQAQQAIQRGLFQKVVPAFSENLDLKPDILFFLKNLFQKTYQMPHGFLYGVWNKKSGILGFTPEILFSLEGNKFSTMALAGTGLYSGPSLLKDQKELKEHDFVIKSLKESLKAVVHWDKEVTREIPFPPLKHLHTELTGYLTQKINFESFCKKLHPTAALGGYPKKQAFEWLKNQISQTSRNFFGAPFGFFHSDKEAFCLVALRGLEWNEKRSMIFSGGGLLKESLLQKEWRELFLKREQVKTFLY